MLHTVVFCIDLKNYFEILKLIIKLIALGNNSITVRVNNCNHHSVAARASTKSADTLLFPTHVTKCN